MTLPHNLFPILTCDLAVTDDTTVSFQYRAVSGARWSELVEAHTDAEGNRDGDSLAVAVYAEAVEQVRATGGDWQPFTADDAAELWTTWPEWCRRDLYAAIYASTIGGPSADPFAVSRLIARAGTTNRHTAGQPA